MQVGVLIAELGVSKKKKISLSGLLFESDSLKFTIQRTSKIKYGAEIRNEGKTKLFFLVGGGVVQSA